MIAAQGAGSSDSGGSGADLQIDAGGSIEIDKTINMFGGGPDGEGGSATLSALLDIILTQPIAAQGIGSEGFGGALEMDADRLLSLRAPIDAHGGPLGGGGSIDLAGGTVEAKAKIDAGGDGGVILIDSHPHDLPAAAGTVTVSGDLHADGAAGGGDLIEIDGCDVTVTPTGSLSASGPAAENLLEASGQMTIQSGGSLSALPAGMNRLVYRNPAKPPLVSTRSIAPPNTQMQDSTLPACRGPVVPVCGDGILEGNEDCDDGNTKDCDGCSHTCRIERCGDGIPECGEACDLGPANGTPGSGCNTSCQRCSLGSGADCPCAEDLDCHPLGRCAGLACEGGLCVLVPVPVCDDGDACTSDFCDALLGCQHSNNTAACDDGNACTTRDTCSGGRCVGGPPRDCDDGALCTDDTCDAVSGCANQPKTGFAAVTCRLNTIDLALQQSQNGDATPKVRQKLGKLLATLRNQLGQAEAAQGNTKRTTKPLRASGK